MKLFILLLFFFSFNSLAEIPFGDCRKYSDYFESQYEKIEEASESRDVSSKIESLNKTLRHFCGKTVTDKTNVKLEEYKQRGYKNHLKLMIEEAERVSEFREPAWEKSELERVSKILKIKNPLDEKRYSDLKALGRSNARKRKSKCSSVDNRKPPLVEIRNGKIIDRPRDQDSIGWCYAFAAADLISHKIGKKVSAIDVANAYNNGSVKDFLGFDETSMEGGFTGAAANTILAKGLCLESQLPSDDYRFSSDSNLEKEYQKVEKLYEQFRNRTSEPGRLFGRNTLEGRKYNEAANSFEQDLACNKLEGEINVLFPTLSTGDFMKIIKEASSANDLVDKLVAKSCKKRISNNLNLEFESDSFLTSTNSMVTTIDKKLEDGDILGLSYRSDTLSDLLEHETNSRHASLIVARKFNETTGSCEYLIRNSWGNSPGGTDPRTRSSGGNHWMPEEYLRQTMDGINYVK